MPRRPKNQRKQFKGDLNKPIMVPEHDYSAYLYELEPGEFEKKRKDYEQRRDSETHDLLSQEADKKLLLLQDHYNLDVEQPSWKSLALELARDFVPGFQLEIKKSRKYAGEIWNPFVLLKLYIDYEQILNELPEHIKTQGKAAQKISKKLEWKKILSSKNGPSAKTIENKISQAKSDSFVRLYLQARELNDQKQIWFLEEMANQAVNTDK